VKGEGGDVVVDGLEIVKRGLDGVDGVFKVGSFFFSFCWGVKSGLVANEF